MKDQKALLIELANALDAASALARMIAEQPEKEVKIKLDEQTFSQAVYRAIEGREGRNGMKELALEKIRRRVETATDMREKVRWKVIGKMIESDLSFDHAGEIVDELGNAWCYLFPIAGGLPEMGGDGLPLVMVSGSRSRGDFVQAYHKALNQSLVLDEEHKQLGLNRIIEAVSLGD